MNLEDNALVLGVSRDRIGDASGFREMEAMTIAFPTIATLFASHDFADSASDVGVSP